MAPTLLCFMNQSALARAAITLSATGLGASS